MFRAKNGGRREEKARRRENAYLLLELSVFLLGVDEVEQDVERAGENKGEEQAEACEVDVSLCAATSLH